MTIVESYWCSKREWVNLDEIHGMTLREDAPPEVQESYRIYRIQIWERNRWRQDNRVNRKPKKASESGERKLNYKEVVKKAQFVINEKYGFGSLHLVPCDLWRHGDQINLWTYWQGHQLRNIDEKGVDVLLVGQDWGNPWSKKNAHLVKTIEKIQAGDDVCYPVNCSTDRNLICLFKAFGDHVDITKKNPGLRLFFTNYSLGYRTGSETGGMTRRLLRMDKEFFSDLVKTIKPKIIICLGKITFEAVTNMPVKGFSEASKNGEPLKAFFPREEYIPVYGVAHCGARGCQNAGGLANMRKAWDRIASDFYSKYCRVNETTTEEDVIKCGQCRIGHWVPLHPESKNNHSFICSNCGIELHITPAATVE